MKRTMTVLAACLLSLLSATAQNLKVADFQLLANDLTANSPGTERTDRNGDKCAILKIQTPEKGFFFDCGLMGHTHLEEHPGETWLWVSPRQLSIAISHELFGKCQYTFKIPIEGGRTYQMLLDIGIGRYVTITTSLAHAPVVVDGEYVGEAPIYNHYLNYGVHTITAERDKHEGTLKRVITENDKTGLVLNVEMQDMTPHYGDVTVSADPRTDIFYNGQKVATGEWRAQLREGAHTIEAQKADCDPMSTTFTVVAQQQNNVKAIAPTPHTGKLAIYTRPRDVEATMNGTQPIDLMEVNTLPIGSYQLQFQRKGYVPTNREFTIKHNLTTADTVQLERIKYVKPSAFYFGAGYTFRQLGGLTALVGATYMHHDLQLSYTFGLSKSSPVHWYSTDGKDNYLSSITYKRSTFAAKYGYLFDLTERIGITPQIGYAIERIAGTVDQGTALYGDNASASCITIGAKLLYAPMQHVYLFAAPELAIGVQKDNNFKNIADASDIAAGGFLATVGVIVHF